MAFLVLTTLFAYWNSFHVPFLFDDEPAITHNPTLTTPLDWPAVLLPRQVHGETTSGRPLVNASFAVNRALHGDAPAGYHVVNFSIHVFAGLALFGIVRRTLRQPQLARRYGERSDLLATLVSAWWLLHPLQTSAVTYLAQRAESLAALFYLLTLYCFVRAIQTSTRARWLGASVLACFAGMASKEIAASAPLLVLVFDRTFVAGTLREAWRQRRGYYVALASSWMLLVLLVLSTQGRGGTAGFATDITPFGYFLTQCGAIVRYLALAFWPHPLVFDYGTAITTNIGLAALALLALSAIAAATIWLLTRRSALGVLGFAFFAILAPSSSFVPIASQTIAEHRMYLPLAAISIAAVFAIDRWLSPRASLVCGVVAAAFAFLTHARNATYADERTLWADTVARRPTNSRAHHNLGVAELKFGRVDVAAKHFRRAIELQPDAADPHYNLGVAQARLGAFREAVEHYRRALALQPNHAEAHNNLGNALLALGDLTGAAEAYEAAVRARPSFAEPHSNLGNALLQLGRPAEALGRSETALRLNPNYADAHFNAANALATLGRFEEAKHHFENVVRLQPSHAAAYNSLGNVLLELDQPQAAIESYERALQVEPRYLEPRRTLGLLLLQLGRTREARPHLEAANRAAPTDQAVADALRALDQHSR